MFSAAVHLTASHSEERCAENYSALYQTWGTDCQSQVFVNLAYVVSVA